MAITTTKTEAKLNAGIFNKYTVMPKNLTQYSAYRGVTDFSQIGQFNQFETGYSFLSVIAMPKFIEEAARYDEDIAQIAFSFKHMLEYEFRGLSGLPDITGATGTITDGLNEMQYINRVTMDTSVTVQMQYFEKRGSLITKFSEYYLTGIKDRISQAKTYHGLIRRGLLEPGLENEVFTFLYYVTDNTMLTLERAYLLANAQLTTAETSMYDSNRSDINNREMTLSFNCFPIMGYQVDKAAAALLQDITGVNIDTTGVDAASIYTELNAEGVYYREDEEFAGKTKPVGTATLDSNSYYYGIMREPGTSVKQGQSIAGMHDLHEAVERDTYANGGKATNNSKSTTTSAKLNAQSQKNYTDVRTRSLLDQ